MISQIQIRRDTAAAWTINNPILLIGELGYETDTLKHKMGDGVNPWTGLAYTPTGTGTGTVTSVALAVPSIFTGSGSPITTNGTLSFTWNGSSANFVRADGSTVPTSTYALASALASYLTTAAAATTYQPLDGDLTAIAALAGTSGLARKTAANTWSLDTATYLTANQTITLSGIITGSGTTAITTAIADAALSIAKTSGLQAALDAKMTKVSASSAAGTVANTTTTTAILSTSLSSANQSPGTLMDITCEGTMRFASLSNTITFTLLLGSVTLGTFNIVGTDITGGAINTDYHYKLSGRLSPQTGPGASSNVGFYGTFTVMGTTASTVVDIAVIGTTINTTVSNNIIVNVAWSAAATDNSITTNYNYVGKLA